ncbi:MAG: hypothetical protein LBH19_13905 [Dysgonamonadaceae bacterium]|jgi:hypothetical protein|nr:hypothetical protein [Dysgonamonadaceae bacterium]
MRITQKRILSKNIILGMFSKNAVVYDRINQYTYSTNDFTDYLWKNKDLIGKAILLTENLLLFSTDETCNIVEKGTGKIMEQFNLSYLSHNGHFILGMQNEMLILIDYIQRKMIWRKNYNFSGVNSLHNNYLFCLFFDDKYNLIDCIFCIDINNGDIIWQFSISDFPSYINGFYREQAADIKQIIGVYNNILWVHVGGWNLVGIDINTGKKVHHITDMLDLLGLDKDERRYFDFETIHLNEKQGILKVFAHRYYFEIDLNILQGEIKKDFGRTWEESWRIKRSTCYQEYPNLLFFSGYYKNVDNPNAFGIFDTEKAEVIWHDTTKDNLGYFYNPPQANDKLLAVLDDKHNLLIYDREDIINKNIENK